MLYMSEPLLNIRQAELRYGGKPVLCGVSLTVSANELLLLTGPNGGGKTTLLRLMAGLSSPFSGHVLRRSGLSVGYLPQYRSIDREFPITVGEVVLSGLVGKKPLLGGYTPSQRAASAEALERLRITGLATTPINALSGGQWQRALLARALAGKPDLLLLDEPETHLDVAAKELLYDIIAEENRRCAVVIVSHDAAFQQHFPHSRKLLVGEGRVAFSGKE